MHERAARTAEQHQAQRRFLLFRLAERLYALPTEMLAEVIRVPRISAVPQSPRALLGVANLRGAVIGIASLRALLGIEERPDISGRAILLAGTRQAAVTIDTIEAFATVDADKIKVDEATLAAEPDEILTGIMATDRGSAKILDIEALLRAAFDRSHARIRSKTAVVRPEPAAPSIREATTDPLRDAERPLIPFDVIDQQYALPMDAVAEIISLPPLIAPLPFAESVVVGITPYRDGLLPLLSLRGLLGLGHEGEALGRSKVVVTSVKHIPVGLVIDGIRPILRAATRQIEETPGLLSARITGEAKISAIYRSEDGRRLVSILATTSLFRDDIMERLQSQISAPQDLKDIRDAHSGEIAQFVVFRLGTEEFCLPIEAVDEVSVVPEMITRIPKTPKFLEGVVNIRGDVVPVIDQRRRFEMPKFHGSIKARRLVVLRSGRHRAGIIVDSVAAILRYPRQAVGEAPGLADDGTTLMKGVINLAETGRMIMVLDPDELLTRAEQGLLDNFAEAAGQAAT